MYPIAVCILVLSYISPLILPDFLANWGQFLHNECLDKINQSSPHFPIYAALICGQSLQASTDKQLIQASGLVHLFVVSGAHILSIEKILNGILYLPKHPKVKQSLFLLFLFNYCCLCLFKAPVVRSFLHHILRKMNIKSELNFHELDLILLSMILCLLIFPQLWLSLSLQLSCAASISLAMSRNKGVQAFCIYFFLFFFLIDLGAPQPISILLNLIVAPIFSLFLLPVSWICSLIHPLSFFSDIIWSSFFALLKALKLECLPITEMNIPSAIKNWLLLLLLISILQTKIWTQKRHLECVQS